MMTPMQIKRTQTTKQQLQMRHAQTTKQQPVMEPLMK